MQSNKKVITKYSILFTVFSVISTVSLLISNIIATKQFQVGPFILPTAMLVFPINYVLSDVVSEVYGYKASRFTAWLGFGANLLMVTVFQLAIILPFPEYFELQNAFSAILGNTPRIFAASTVSYMAGDFINDLVFKLMKRKHGENKFTVRAIVSSMAGEAIDAGMFIPLAFYGAMPIGGMLQMIITQWALKIVYEIIILPITATVTKRLKTIEYPNIKADL